MPRPDLLSLTPDDLAMIGNRGIVKRAQQEMASGQLSYRIEEDASGSVVVRWSDDVECRLPARAILSDGLCSCPATTLCRHLVRSVLAYQAWVTSVALAPALTEQEGDRSQPSPPTHPPPIAHPWDPGSIPDEALESFVPQKILARARAELASGQVIELARTVKPTALFHSLSVHLRFLVPDDARYVHCDCAAEPPCIHVPMAVWAFHELDSALERGIVTTGSHELPTPVDLLDDLERSLVDLAVTGVAGIPQANKDRFRRLERRCRDEGLVWPAEILADLVHQCDCYTANDARFSPDRVLDLSAELCIRMDVIRSKTGGAPQLFVRGSRFDRPGDVGSARMVGLGCGVRIHRSSVELETYLQDLDTGMVTAIFREFAGPPAGSDAPARDFWQMSGAPVNRGISIGGIGSGQLLVQGGKRSASGRYSPGRAPVALNPQGFQWETLRPPVLVEGFEEVRAHLASLSPASLRPRRVGQDFYVCPVARVVESGFSAETQEVVAVLEDASGATARLVHPFTSRGQEGCDRLVSWLSTRPDDIRFVAGRFRMIGTQAEVSPVSLVFQDGDTRRMIQPWIDRRDPGQSPTPASAPERAWRDPLSDFVADLRRSASDLLQVGVQRADSRTARAWTALVERGRTVGFSLLLEPMVRLADALERQAASIHPDPAAGAPLALDIAVLVHLAQDA